VKVEFRRRIMKVELTRRQIVIAYSDGSDFWAGLRSSAPCLDLRPGYTEDDAAIYHAIYRGPFFAIITTVKPRSILASRAIAA
jgi:hypothetical protein